jgi:hypothetical protein
MANLKQRVFAENRNGLIRAFRQPVLDFTICSSFLNLWLTSSFLLSKKNCEFAGKHVVLLRQATPVDDINKQVTLDRIDSLLANALARCRKRAEKQQRDEDAKPKRPVGRPRKDVKPVEAQKVDRRFKPVEAPPKPTEDPMDIWLTMPTEKKS